MGFHSEIHSEVSHQDREEKATESRHPYRGAVNCQAATAVTESMLQQHPELCTSAWSHNDQRFARIWRNKRERLLDKVSATSMRTVEVTIYILDRPRQLPHVWKIKLSKTTITVSLFRATNVLS